VSRVPTPVTGGAVVSKHKAQFARELRARSTSAEKVAWEALRARRVGGLKFRRQQPIAGFIVDFVCVELGLVVEIDGGIHDNQREADAARTQVLESRGFRVVRIQNEDVSAAYLEKVITHFASGSPSP
jgi:leucyl-tRNA synthetase